MLSLVKTISTELDNLQRRLIKVLRNGRSDIQTPYESAPYGVDSNPVKDMIAVYAPTTLGGKEMIIGYINKNQLAGIGEHRIYSTDTAGELSSFIWLKNNGTMEVGGNADNMVRYAALEEELESLKDKINIELTKIQTGLSGIGGAYTKQDVTIDITGAKIEEIKTL